MSKNKRPMYITVIGWFWILLNVVLCLIVGILFLAPLIAAFQSIPDKNIPIRPIFFMVFSLILTLISIFGIVSGINFLKLKSWTRKALEIHSWLFLIILVGVGFYWTVVQTAFSKGLSLLFLILPLVIILKYLRVNTVRKVFGAIVEPVDEPVTYAEPVDKALAPSETMVAKDRPVRRLSTIFFIKCGLFGSVILVLIGMFLSTPQGDDSTIEELIYAGFLLILWLWCSFGVGFLLGINTRRARQFKFHFSLKWLFISFWCVLVVSICICAIGFLALIPCLTMPLMGLFVIIIAIVGSIAGDRLKL
jgi:hypothetical protein